MPRRIPRPAATQQVTGRSASRQASRPVAKRPSGTSAHQLFATVKPMHEHTVRTTTTNGVVEGFVRDGVNRWRSIPYARAAGRSAAVPGAPAGAAVARGSVLPQLRQLRTATAALHDARPRQVPADGRGLPDAQRGDPIVVGFATRSGAAAGDVLHPRRRLHPGQFGHPALRRSRAGPPRVRLRVGELPPRRPRLSGPVVAVDARGPDRQQPVPARPRHGAGLGSRQHRGLRRRPRQRHHLRRERRGARRCDTARCSRRQRTVPPR